MNANYTNRMETLKMEFAGAIEKGTYASFPVDEFGITPETRLQWGIDSLEYIAGIGNSIKGIDRHIQDNLERIYCDNPDEVVLSICHSIEAQSRDCYVTEGIDNIQRCISILEPTDNEIHQLRIKLARLEKEVEESKARARAATKEAIRLTMLLEHVLDNIERQQKST